MAQIVVLMTVFNRIALTVECLKSISATGLYNDGAVDIVVVDDKSTDSTNEILQSKFPDVKVISTPGDCFWSGGMRFGFEYIQSNYDFNYLFVVNNDVQFFSDRLNEFLLRCITNESGDTVFVGSICDRDDNFSYGGRKRVFGAFPFSPRPVVPAGSPAYVDTCNMNAVFIPKIILDDIGFLSPKFVHGMADFDWSWRLVRNSYKAISSEFYIGRCDRNSPSGTSYEVGISLRERYRRFFSTKEQPLRSIFALYLNNYKVSGLLWILITILKPVLYHIKLIKYK